MVSKASKFGRDVPTFLVRCANKCLAINHPTSGKVTELSRSVRSGFDLVLLDVECLIRFWRDHVLLVCVAFFCSGDLKL